MPKETDKAPLTPSEDSEETKEAPRAKTPLERVREGQAQMRGQQNNSKHGSSETDRSGAMDSYKRRMRQRKSG
jgi:hypothetical protein